MKTASSPPPPPSFLFGRENLLSLLSSISSPPLLSHFLQTLLYPIHIIISFLVRVGTTFCLIPNFCAQWDSLSHSLFPFPSTIPNKHLLFANTWCWWTLKTQQQQNMPLLYYYTYTIFHMGVGSCNLVWDILFSSGRFYTPTSLRFVVEWTCNVCTAPALCSLGREWFSLPFSIRILHSHTPFSQITFEERTCIFLPSSHSGLSSF